MMNVAEICERRDKQRLFARTVDPQLPPEDTIYGRAKRLEFSGDLGGALAVYLHAMRAGERADSAMKDIAGLLNMLGRSREAVEFLKANEKFVVNKLGYFNLLDRLEADNARESTRDLPRSVAVSVASAGGLSLGPVSMTLCDRLFPNPGKILRILHLDGLGEQAVVHFASHSAARKAVAVRRLIADVSVDWALPQHELVMKHIEDRETNESKIKITVDVLPEHLAAFADKTGIPMYSAVTDAAVKSLVAEHTATVEPPAASRQVDMPPMLPYVAELPDDDRGRGTAAIVFPIVGMTVDHLPRDLEILIDVVIAAAQALKHTLLLNRPGQSEQDISLPTPENPKKALALPADSSNSSATSEGSHSSPTSPPVFFTPSPVVDRLLRLF